MEHANDLSVMIESDKKQQNLNTATIPAITDRPEVLARVTLKETCNRKIPALIRVSECDESPLGETEDRMKRRFCELLILRKALERSVL